MNKKIKVLLAFLGILSICAAGVAGWIYFYAQGEITKFADKEAELKKQNTYLEERYSALEEKLNTTQLQARQWQEKAQAVTAELNKLTGEHALLTSQYDALIQERGSLVAKNKSLQEQVENINQLYSQAQEKVPVDISDTFLAALLEEKATLEVELTKLKDKISAQETQVEELDNQAKPFEELQEEKRAVEQELADAKKVAEVLSNELLQEKKKIAALENKQLAQTTPTPPTTVQQSAPAGEVLVGAVEETMTTDQPQQYASIQLPPIVVRAQEPRGDLDEKEVYLPRLTRSRLVEVEEPEGPEIALEPEEAVVSEGRVITVNKKHKFIVINLGGDDGVEKGMKFDVYRNEMMVGRVEVIETRKNIAACDIKEARGASLKINDIVRR